MTDICVYLDVFGRKKLPAILFSRAFSVRLSNYQFMDSHGGHFRQKPLGLGFVIISILFGQNLG